MHGQTCKTGIYDTTVEKYIPGAVHNDFLRNFLPKSLQGVDLHIRVRLWLQHDGAHLHLLLAFRTFLNNVFSGTVDRDKMGLKHGLLLQLI